jgi:transposase
MNSIQQTILPFQLKETNDCMTSRSGLLVFFEAAIRFGLTDKIKEIFPRPGSNRGYNAHDIIMSLILMMLSGGQHMNDIREIAQDTALLKLCGIKNVPSPDTVARFIARPDNLRRINFLIEYLNRQVLGRITENMLTVDIDATLIESEKRAAAITYEGFPGYCPMLSFEASRGLCLIGEFRDGNISPSTGILDHLKYIKRLLKKAGKQMRAFRSDSAAYNHNIFDFCFNEGILFYVVADHDSSIMAAIKTIPENQWKPYFDKDGVKTDDEYAVTVHALNASTNAFTLAVKRWLNPQMNLFEAEKYCYFIVATSDFDSEGMEILHFYNLRGNAENFIKETKNGVGLENVPTGELYSNKVYFAIGLLAYNLSIGFKDFLPEEFKHSTLATLRFYLIFIPGKAVMHGRQLILKLKKRFLVFIELIRRSLVSGYLPA